DMNEDKSIKESVLLKLNCDKALHELQWTANLNFELTIRMLCDWYKEFYQNQELDMYDFTVLQIQQYIQTAVINNLSWCCDGH
ncbi:MAG: CDP-glucose 4,6-dehydratase, partial [Candidatus Hodarchaeota archaeon]